MLSIPATLTPLVFLKQEIVKKFGKFIEIVIIDRENLQIFKTL